MDPACCCCDCVVNFYVFGIDEDDAVEPDENEFMDCPLIYHSHGTTDYDPLPTQDLHLHFFVYENCNEECDDFLDFQSYMVDTLGYSLIYSTSLDNPTDAEVTDEIDRIEDEEYDAVDTWTVLQAQQDLQGCP